MPAKKKKPLTQQEIIEHRLKLRYHALTLEINSYLHDLHSHVFEKMPHIESSYKEKVDDLELELQEINKKLRQLGYDHLGNKWIKKDEVKH